MTRLLLLILFIINFSSTLAISCDKTDPQCIAKIITENNFRHESIKNTEYYCEDDLKLHGSFEWADKFIINEYSKRGINYKEQVILDMKDIKYKTIEKSNINTIIQIEGEVKISFLKNNITNSKKISRKMNFILFNNNWVVCDTKKDNKNQEEK